MDTSKFIKFYNTHKPKCITEAHSKSCVFYIGKFHPFTAGHYKVVDRMIKENRDATPIIVITKSKTDKDHPFDIDTRLALIPKKLKSVCHILISDNGNLFSVITNIANANYVPTKLYAGEDRSDYYQSQLDREDIKLLNHSIEICNIDRNDDISGTECRHKLLSCNDPSELCDVIPVFNELCDEDKQITLQLLKQKLQDSLK